MAEGIVVNVPESRWEWFKGKFDALARKAKKLTDESPSIMVIGQHFAETPTNKNFKHKMFEVFVACPEVKIAGWTFCGTIDHSLDIGSVLRAVPGKQIPDQYRGAEPICEHCRVNRRRRDTYILQNDEGIYKQVGRSCLRDFTGHASPEQLARFAELLAQIPSLVSAARDDYSNDTRDYRYIDTLDFATHVAREVRVNGWVSKARAAASDLEATAVSASTNYAKKGTIYHSPVTEFDRQLAQEAIEWACNFGEDGSDISDWEYNSRVVAMSPAIEYRHTGILSSIVGVYFDRKTKREAEAAKPKANAFVGEVGARMTIEAVLKYHSANEFSVRYVFETEDGNTLVWFSSKGGIGHRRGEKLKMTFTVKAHNEYKGVNQTLITRAKVAE